MIQDIQTIFKDKRLSNATIKAIRSADKKLQTIINADEALKVAKDVSAALAKDPNSEGPWMSSFNHILAALEASNVGTTLKCSIVLYGIGFVLLVLY